MLTFAQKLIAHGDYEAAVAEAAKHLGREPENPEPYHDRARALSLLGRFAESVADYARAIELDQTEQILQDHELDDGLFSTLLLWCEVVPEKEARLALLRRYEEILPAGLHRKDAAEWALRFQGLLPTQFVKPRD